MKPSMSAYEGMTTILDINETIEDLKNMNTDTVPNMVLCRAVDILTSCRTLLVAEMKATTLGVFEDDGK